MPLLYCPTCKRRQKTKPEADDPPGTATVEIWCPKCVGGDFDSVTYRNADGKEIKVEV